MFCRGLKCLIIVAFSQILTVSFNSLFAQENEAEGEKKEKASGFEPGKVIMEHITDNHSFHFFDYDGKSFALPLPVILYSPQKGFDFFMSSEFEHGHKAHNGYQLINDHYLEQLKEEGIDTKSFINEQIIAVNAEGKPDNSVKVYDLSLTRNVVQMFIALFILVLLLTKVAAKYKKNGSKVAPSGFQNAVEPVITFIRDEVGKPNMGHKYEKYMPYLLTVFFFILINNLFGLIPGSANVTGNIAFTLIMAAISFLVILFNSNKHFWAHIFNPSVPFGIKFILVPVEFLGVFTKPFALMIRLFANMIAGHMMITCLILLIFIFANISKFAGLGFSPVSIAFTVFVYLIEILVAFIQAFIFTNLTAVFVSQAFEGSHDEHH